MRRFTRSTNGFSKKVENHAATVALHFMYYNFGRVHQALRVTPAMEGGLAQIGVIFRGVLTCYHPPAATSTASLLVRTRRTA